MTATINAGPNINAGQLIDALGTNVPQNTNPSAGPNLSYQADAFLDPRFFPINKEQIDRHAVIPSFYNPPAILTLNAIPQAKTTAGIAALANVVSGTAMTLVTTPGTGISTNIPILANPFGTSSTVVAPITMDFGFDFGNLTSGSKNVTVANSAIYQVGMPLIIAQALTTTTPLITYVTGITSATVITIANAAGNTNAAAPIGTGNSWSALDGPNPVLSTYAWPYLAAGPAAMDDPTQSIARCVSITGVASGTGGAFLVKGWDIYGVPMSQLITVAAGVNTVNSTKAFKYIQSVTPQFTDAHNYSVGTADIIGIDLRSDLWEQMEIFYVGAFLTSSTGYTPAVATSPATTTTGDVRGTYALQSAANGTNRISIYQTLSQQQIIKATPSSYISLFGVTQV